MKQDNKIVSNLIFVVLFVFLIQLMLQGCSSNNNSSYDTANQSESTTQKATDSNLKEENQAASMKKVTIKAYLNLSGCQTETTDLLDGLVKEYKGQVSVEYIDFSTKDGYERTVKDGLNCSGLIINGKQTYTIKDKSGKQHEVTFSHPINSQYTAEDVKTVVSSLLGK